MMANENIEKVRWWRRIEDSYKVIIERFEERYNWKILDVNRKEWILGWWNSIFAIEVQKKEHEKKEALEAKQR